MTAVLLLASVAVQAHDGEVEYVEFDDVGLAVALTVEHQDAAPFKGWFTIATVKNISNVPWGDFHFELILDLPNWDPSEVYFSNAETSWTTIPSASYSIDATQTKLDFYFYDSPLMPGSTAMFAVYTDNTRGDNNPFGMMFYPTPVPEPATLAVLAMGGLLALRKRR